MRYIEINEGTMNRRYKDTRRQPINHIQAFEFIRDHCMNAYDGDPIFRGAKRRKASEGAMFVDTSTAAPRASANTKSYVGIIMDTQQAWKEYPKRSRSLICSNQQSYAQAYGVVYRVFPVNGTKIGVCPSVDVWSSFTNLTVPFLNAELQELSKMFLFKELSETPAEFLQQLELITEHLDNIGGFDRIKENHRMRTLTDASEKLMTNDIKSILNVLLNPKANGFLLTTIETLSVAHDEHELWFEGKAIMVPKPLWNDLDVFMKAE